MERGHDKNGYAKLWFDPKDRRITIDDLITYQCVELNGKIQLICAVHGGLHMALPIDKSIDLETLVFLCDRMAFMAWGIHGKFGTFGIEIPLTEFEEL